MGFIVTIIVFLAAALIIVSPAVILFWAIAALRDYFKGRKGNNSYPPPINKYVR